MDILRDLAKRVFSDYGRAGSRQVWTGGQRCRVLIEAWPGFAADRWLAALDQGFDVWRQSAEVRFVENRADRAALAPGAEVYVSAWLSDELLQTAPRLKWVQVMLGGTEFLDDLRLPADLAVTTLAGVAAEGMAEHALALMLALDRRIDLAVSRQRLWRWSQKGIRENIRGLRGRTLGVIGLGHSGRALARRARALEMEVIGLTRRPSVLPEGVGAGYQPDRLMSFLERADFVVLCVPLTAQTRQMIGREQLVALGKDSYLVNIARAGLVDERALAWALRNHQIGGAALDVLSREPPSWFHPLRGCPNLIVTPHVGGNIHVFKDEAMGRFVDNLRAFVAGEPLEGLYVPPVGR